MGSGRGRDTSFPYPQLLTRQNGVAFATFCLSRLEPSDSAGQGKSFHPMLPCLTSSKTGKKEKGNQLGGKEREKKKEDIDDVGREKTVYATVFKETKNTSFSIKRKCLVLLAHLVATHSPPTPMLTFAGGKMFSDILSQPLIFNLYLFSSSPCSSYFLFFKLLRPLE